MTIFVIASRTASKNIKLYNRLGSPTLIRLYFYFMEKEIEVWKDIPNYEGFYQASNLGNIKSLERMVKHWPSGLKTVKERILKANPNTQGYLSLWIYKDSISKKIQVHKLVAMAFLNHVPNGYEIVVNHKDFNILNNKLSNLELVSQRENTNRKHLKSTSKYTGVYWYKRDKKWKSSIQVNGKNKNLGTFENEHDAHLAYQKELDKIKILSLLE